MDCSARYGSGATIKRPLSEGKGYPITVCLPKQKGRVIRLSLFPEKSPANYQLFWFAAGGSFLFFSIALWQDRERFRSRERDGTCVVAW